MKFIVEIHTIHIPIYHFLEHNFKPLYRIINTRLRVRGRVHENLKEISSKFVNLKGLISLNCH